MLKTVASPSARGKAAPSTPCSANLRKALATDLLSVDLEVVLVPLFQQLVFQVLFR